MFLSDSGGGCERCECCNMVRCQSSCRQSDWIIYRTRYRIPYTVYCSDECIEICVSVRERGSMVMCVCVCVCVWEREREGGCVCDCLYMYM